MKLQSRQIIGLMAIIVFGGGLIFRLTQPSEREIMEKRVASLPHIEVPEPKLPALDLYIPTVTMPDVNAPDTGGATDTRKIYELSGTDYFAGGSQAAKDDMYCSGVLSAEFKARINDSHPDKASLILRDHEALDQAGINKLIAEGVTTEQASSGYSLAYGDKAQTDYDAKALRISVEDCSQRAAALN